MSKANQQQAAAETEPRWVRTALLRGGVAALLGGSICLAYALIADRGFAFGLRLSVSGLLGGLLVFALAVLEQFGWGRAQKPGTTRLLAFSALASLTTSLLCFAIQLQATYTAAQVGDGDPTEGWQRVHDSLLNAWDFPVSRVAALGCFGVAAGFCTLARGAGLRLWEQCAVSLLGVLPLGGWVVLGTEAIPDERERRFVFVMLGVAALLFPLASWVGDWLQRRWWGTAPSAPTRRRRLHAWCAVLVLAPGGAALGAGVQAWHEHQAWAIQELAWLDLEAAEAERAHDWELMLAHCEAAIEVGLRGRSLRRSVLDMHEIASWMLDPPSAAAPMSPSFEDNPQFRVFRAEWREKQGELTGALRDYDRAIEIRRDPAWLQARALLKVRADQLDAALKDFDKAISLSPQASFFVGRATLREHRGDLAGARDDLHAAFGMVTQREHLGLHRALAEVHHWLGDPERVQLNCNAGLELYREGLTSSGWREDAIVLYRFRAAHRLASGQIHEATHDLAELRKLLWQNDAENAAFESPLLPTSRGRGRSAR